LNGGDFKNSWEGVDPIITAVTEVDTDDGTFFFLDYNSEHSFDGCDCGLCVLGDSLVRGNEHRSRNAGQGWDDEAQEDRGDHGLFFGLSVVVFAVTAVAQW
jgi:hypothetical protein